jgi:hypothetical protein
MAERIPELFIEDGLVPKPDIRLVPQLGEAHDSQIDMDTTHLADVYVDVTVEVDGVPRQLWVDVSKRTLGNGQSVRSYFERFEYIHADSNGRLVGDFGRADLLAESALALADRHSDS